MKDRYFKLKNLVVAILLLLVVVYGCKQGDQSLGANLLPGVKILKTYYYADSTTIITSISTDTKIRVDRPKYNLLGSFNDPVFGRTDASFAAQFRLPYHPAYSKTASIDSIVLRMTYKKIYGDTISRQTLKVYELTSGLNYDAKYLSSFDLKNITSSTPIGSNSFIPKFRTDSLKTDTTEQSIRVKLNNSFGTSLLGMDSLKMKDNDEFLKYFKGLYIGAAPINRKGTLVSINTTASAIVLYYHDEKSDTLGFAYRVNANSANIASYVHDYTTAIFKTNLDQDNNTDSLIYIQPTGGIKSKILIPSFSAWQHKDSANYLINSATLTFHVDTIMSDFRRYSRPDRLYLVLLDKKANGDEVLTADSISSNYGGLYNPTNATIVFSVTQHLQKLIKGSIENKGFYLVSSPSDRNSSARRIVVKGSGSMWGKPKINITYTRYKE